MSESGTETEIISLDTSLRMEGVLRLNVQDTIIDLLEPISHGDLMRKRQQKSRVKREKINGLVEDLGHVPPNAHISSKRPSLFLCLKDNEAVIKMIIKGRSPNISHVSSTHTVDLDRF